MEASPPPWVARHHAPPSPSLHLGQLGLPSGHGNVLPLCEGKWLNMAHFVRSLTYDMSRNGGHRWTCETSSGSHEMMLWFVRIWSRARSSLVGNMAHGIVSCWVPSLRAEKGPHRHHFPGRSMRWFSQCQPSWKAFSPGPLLPLRNLWRQLKFHTKMELAMIFAAPLSQLVLTGPHQESVWEISVFLERSQEKIMKKFQAQNRIGGALLVNKVIHLNNSSNTAYGLHPLPNTDNPILNHIVT